MIDEEYLDVLKTLYARLEKSNISWAVTGSLGMALQNVDVTIHDIDIQTDEKGAYEIEKLLSEYVIAPVHYKKSEHIRSHFGSFEINGIKVEVMGAIQKYLENEIWEEPVVVEKHKKWIEIDGIKIPVLSLEYEYEAYTKLSRKEKAEMLREWLKREGR